MSAYDQVYKAYTDSQKNSFWDAWGIVANPITIRELTADAKSRMELNYEVNGDVATIFGLVVIPCTLCERNKVYVVDEQLGKTILGTKAERSSK